ncbi:MAG: CDGSH iron-sulfur domain-containing protein [Candidatus Methanomethylophilaceae archaeon]|jgi:CDGSH-type Zn-finger protein|nr:CDGSH iron-sulfur domain-containing protein [Candidatus Methanomethylophilaceae archaeon]NLF33559.1 CDGSH iron-sulfur domain-containing protein [Thermoplasmatales archaeon]
MSNEKIKVTKDGPYLVFGDIPLYKSRIVLDGLGKSVSWEKSERLYPDGNVYSLCRCGLSKEKPYCDSSHVKGFDGTETAPMTRFEERANIEKGAAGIELLQDPRLCTGSGFCHAGSSISRAIKKEKTLPNAKKQCMDCAGGSLVLSIDGQMFEESLPKEITVTTTPRMEGPLRVTGCVPVVSAEGEEYENRNRVALCRCGLSKNKPFCDAQHLK